MPELAAPDLAAAQEAVVTAQAVVDAAIASVNARGGIDENQVVVYDLAHAASAVATARSCLDYGAKGDLEARIACAFGLFLILVSCAVTSVSFAP